MLSFWGSRISWSSILKGITESDTRYTPATNTTISFITLNGYFPGELGQPVLLHLLSNRTCGDKWHRLIMGQMTFLSPNWAKALKKTQSTNVIHHWTLTSSTTGHWHHPPLNTDAIYHWVIYRWTLTSSTTEHWCHLPLNTDAIYHWTLTSFTTEHWCHLPLDTDVIYHLTLMSSITGHWRHLSRDTNVIYHWTLMPSTTELLREAVLLPKCRPSNAIYQNCQ